MGYRYIAIGACRVGESGRMRMGFDCERTRERFQSNTLDGVQCEEIGDFGAPCGGPECSYSDYSKDLSCSCRLIVLPVF